MILKKTMFQIHQKISKKTIPWLILALIPIILFSSFSAAQLVTIEELFPFSTKNYRVRFDDNKKSFDNSKKSNPNELIDVALDGKQYVCQIPEIAQKKSISFFSKGTDEEKTTEKDILKQISDSANKVLSMKNEIMKTLTITFSDFCIYRLQGWWNYEFCFNRHIRQFHANQLNIVEDQFFLGHLSAEIDKKFKSNEDYEFDKSSDSSLKKLSSLLTQNENPKPKKPVLGFRTGPMTMSNEEKLEREAKAKEIMQININKEVPELSYVSFEFKNGTPCDITKEPRSIEIRLSCLSKSMIQKIANINSLTQNSPQKPEDITAGAKQMVIYPDTITEPGTCKYLLKIYAASLCEIEGFGGSGSKDSDAKSNQFVDSSSSLTENTILCIPRTASAKQKAKN